jgi:hypothetical protein
MKTHCSFRPWLFFIAGIIPALPVWASSAWVVTPSALAAVEAANFFDAGGGAGGGPNGEEIPGAIVTDATNDQIDMWYYRFATEYNSGGINMGGDIVYHVRSTDNGSSWGTPTPIVIPKSRKGDGTWLSNAWPNSGVGVFTVISGSSAFSYNSDSWKYIGFGESGDWHPDQVWGGKNTIGAFYLKSDGTTVTEITPSGYSNPVIKPYDMNASNKYGAGLPHLVKLWNSETFRLYFVDDTYNGSTERWYVEFVADSNESRGFRFTTPASVPGNADNYALTVDGIVRRHVPDYGTDDNLGGIVSTRWIEDVAVVWEPSAYNSHTYYALGTGNNVNIAPGPFGTTGKGGLANTYQLFQSDDGIVWTNIDHTDVPNFSSARPSQIGPVWVRNSIGLIDNNAIRYVADFLENWVSEGSPASQMKLINLQRRKVLFDFEHASSSVHLDYINCSTGGLQYDWNNPNQDNVAWWDMTSTGVSGVADLSCDLSDHDLSGQTYIGVKWFGWQSSNSSQANSENPEIRCWVVDTSNNWYYLGAATATTGNTSEHEWSMAGLSSTARANIAKIVLRNDTASLSGTSDRQRLHAFGLWIR